MKFKRLRVAGFKTFVDATDFLIEPGLTGIVGPNGCGKSNLVEALRWVMGENSYKSMRGSGMDDVIFSGGGSRPGRNTAEVTLVLDNGDRLAPAGFNDSDSLEITRRIEREAGSTYRINGREVRARDVQMLFADASTGARSPAMVRQGQISEIIAARPQARRRVLEEAAGIAGLHSRRHEAELRLKAADENALRVADVLRQIETQVEGLKRQARQTARYRLVAADLRRAEALVLLIHVRAIDAEHVRARQKLDADTRDVAERTLLQAETARLAALAVHALPSLREAEAKALAGHQRLVLALEALDGEEARAVEKGRELMRRIGQFEEALAREAALIVDADAMLQKLDAEESALADEAAFASVAENAMRVRLADCESLLERSEAALQTAQAAFSESAVRRANLEAGRDDALRRLARIDAERDAILAECATLQAKIAEETDIEVVSADLEDATYAAGEAEEQALIAEDRHAAAREAEAASRTPLQTAERLAERRDTEYETLRQLLDAGATDRYPPAIDRVTVAKGYERALGAALGEDLDAALDPAALAYWTPVEPSGSDPALPEGVVALKTFVEAPAALGRRLAQIGLVDRAQGALLQARLRPGQRLVSREGDFWRWDGLTTHADAPSPVARRLTERNRLGDLAQNARAARAALMTVRQMAEQAQAELRAAAAHEADMRTAARAAGRVLEEARLRANAAERARALVLSRLAALRDARTRLDANREDAVFVHDESIAALAALKPDADLGAVLDAARLAAGRDRTATADLRATAQGFLREADRRQRRRQAIVTDHRSWTERRIQARAQTQLADARLAEARADHAALDDAPEEFGRQRDALKKAIQTAAQDRDIAIDRRKEAEASANRADRTARTALEDMARVREERASSQARVDAMAQRRADIVHTIAVEMNCAPPGLPAIAGVRPDAVLPDVVTAEQSIESLRRDREKLGSVNLRAEDELAEVEKTRDGLLAEHADLTEAVKRLRQAILNLNREGRERLLAAFDVVNGHFKTLFTTLFGGGAAELQLIESEDPLEGGLEILARPPGKRPATMTLLSGGEQALTALSLIFAVFLTNPSPICVLDEVDAPLDDSNVERLCNLLDEMARRTDTRFMTITHNPITMARMDRLFGVTMAERGISQLVSVDLQTAEQFREAG